ncbi:hypothetical protein DV735_g2591, partial [Chaetothyriales sp. CBS 134920]
MPDAHDYHRPFDPDLASASEDDLDLDELDPTGDVQLHRITAPPTRRVWKGRRLPPNSSTHDTADTGWIASFSRDLERGWNVSKARRQSTTPHDHPLLPNGSHSRAQSFRASLQLSRLVTQELDDLKDDRHAGNHDPRDIQVGQSQGRHFPPNVVSNAKYTPWSFLPKALFNEFKFFLNVYFLLVALSQLIPYLRIGYMITYIVPLASVFGHPTDVIEVQKRARDIKVGDVLKLEKNQRVPADVVILQARVPDSASGEGADDGPESAELYIRTDQLDGETDWKLRLPSPLSQALGPRDFTRLQISAGAPDKKVNEFVGSLALQPHPAAGQYDPFPADGGEDAMAKTDTQPASPTSAPLTIDNTAWASTVIASNTTVYAAVVYTGRQTRSALSTSPSRSKTGLLELEINNLTKILCVMTLTLSIVLVALEGFQPSNSKPWYVAIMIYLILFSTIIPISLRVNLDMAKLVYGRFIQRDQGIPGTVVRTSTIPEDLGRIEYLLSDKTGTLTQNEMRLRKIHVGTGAYAGDAMEEVAAYVHQAFGSANSNALQSSATKARREVATRVRDLIVALALCHNVTPTKEEVNGQEFVSYQASSPDEIAIVEFTETVGLRLAHRDRESITVESSDTGQPVLRAHIKEIFPFTSESKRMAIIVQLTTHSAVTGDTSELWFFEKGADTVMSSIVATNDWLDEETGNMARHGLRTLVVARRKLSQEQYEAFSAAYKQASLVLHDREAGMATVVKQHLEHDLELLGVTGVEDRLQKDVKPSLELLRNAGIKIWMLTGDKIETARCVAISARLVARGQHIHTLAKLRRKQDAQDALDVLGHHLDSCLLLDGESLALMLTHFRHKFISLAVRLPAVIACRCSPTQKAEVALLIRQHTNKRVCCIGDGGNDVSMIQAADVGIGIVGKEGRQASLAADFSITQFSYLTKLLLWHGRNSYKRSAKLGQFIIHRGLIIAVCQTMYNIASNFDPKGLFIDWLLVGYATVYTTAPVFSLVLDTDVDEQVAKLYPELYKELKAGQALSYRSFFTWVAVSVYQGIIIQGLSQLLVGEIDGNRMLAVSFTVLILNELIMVAVSVTTWHPVMIASILGTAAIYAISVPFLPSYFDLEYVASWAWAWRVVAIASISLVPTGTGNRRVNPVITILGATGTGKSALAVSLARRFNGEIINADAMQMYRGLPIITNKISADEQEGVRHHMLDFIGLHESPWTVKRFVAVAKKEIEGIRGRGKLPIVVGGTGLGDGGDGGMTVEEMYAKLQELDPEMARTWHPRDKRRIERSLEICLKTGRKASEWYKEQHEAEREKVAKDSKDGVDGQEGLSGLQYDSLILWLEAEDAVLKERLNARVDAMVAKGLLEEVLELHQEDQRFQHENVVVDKTKGIWQSIGYKELELWATRADRPVDDNSEAMYGNLSTTHNSKSVADGIEGIKAGTRQYAKRQNRYIRNRFSSALRQSRALDRLFLLDSTDISRWGETVVPQSEELVSAFLEGRQLPDAATLSDLAGATFARITKQDDWRSSRLAHHCEICDKTLMGVKEWERHVTSRSHKTVIQSQRRRAARDAFLAQRAALVGTDGVGSQPPQ